MHKIATAAANMERMRISHFQAFLLTWPVPTLEAILLLVFSLVDPPKQTEELNLDNENAIQTITCGFQSEAFFIAQLSFHVILVGIGCILAYKSRHLNPLFGTLCILKSRILLFQNI